MRMGDAGKYQYHPLCVYQPRLLPKPPEILRKWEKRVTQIPKELNQGIDGFWKYIFFPTGTLLDISAKILSQPLELSATQSLPRGALCWLMLVLSVEKLCSQCRVIDI